MAVANDYIQAASRTGNSHPAMAGSVRQAEWRNSYPPFRAAYRQTPPEWRSEFTNDPLAIAAFFAEEQGDRLSIRCDHLEVIVHRGGSL